MGCLFRRTIILYAVIVSIIATFFYTGKFYIYKGTTNSRLETFSDGESSNYLQRIEELQQACKTKPYAIHNTKFKLTKRKYLLYNKQNHFLFCFVQKIGCTFWKQAFLTLESIDVEQIKDKSVIHKHELPTLHNLKDTEVVQLTNTSFSVLFVRDPYTRLFSGYVDKFLYPNPHYWASHGVHIIRRYRKNATKRSLSCGHDVTFAEFAQYVVDVYAEKRILLDDHFSPIYRHCRPCEIDYKFIGKMETFEADTKYVFNKLNEQSLSKLLGKNNKTTELLYIIAERNEKLSCLSSSETTERISKTLLYRGLVDSLDFSKMNLNETKFGLDIQNYVRNQKTYKKSEKRKYMVEHYKTLNKRLLDRVQSFVKPDCKLFKYDDRPQDIFGS